MVDERTAQVEQRIREVLALNRLSQQQMSKRYSVLSEDAELLDQLQTINEELGALAKRAQSLPNLEYLPGFATAEYLSAFAQYSEVIWEVQRISLRANALARRAQLLPRIEDLPQFELGPESGETG